jgi:hypothetical protein
MVFDAQLNSFGVTLVKINLSNFLKKPCNPQISATFASQIIEAIICHDTR